MKRNSTIIIIAAVYQVLGATYLLRIDGFAAINSILFFIAGLLITFCLLRGEELGGRVIRRNEGRGLTVSRGSRFWFTSRFNIFKFIQLVIVLLLVVSGIYFSRIILDHTPIAIEHADMLPVIRVMGDRFIDGQWHQVYSPIPEIWGGAQPVYLPAMWLPFVPAIYFDFDMRWITVAGILFAALAALWPLRRERFTSGLSTAYFFLLLIALLTLLSWFYFDEVNNVIRLTEEGVVYFYYALLVYAIVRGNAILIGCAMALCLLSRYALIGALPAIGVYWLLRKEYQRLTKVFIAGAVLVCVLMLLPFGWRIISLMGNLPGEYIAHAKLEWSRNPEYFYNSLGMAKFFGPMHVELLHRLLVYGTFIMPLLLLLYGWYRKRRGGAWPNNMVLALVQLSVTVFYNFIDVSYLYLYYTPVFVSLVIAALTSEKRTLLR